MIEIVPEIVSPEEADALASLVELPPPAHDACQAMPYSVIDPCAGSVQREVKYLLNQARVRIIEIVERATGLQRLYPASTMLRCWTGPLIPAGDSGTDWWIEYRAVIPLDCSSSLLAGERNQSVAPRALVFASALSTWSLVPEHDDSPWLGVTVTLTDQLDRCEL